MLDELLQPVEPTTLWVDTMHYRNPEIIHRYETDECIWTTDEFTVGGRPDGPVLTTWLVSSSGYQRT
jgi:hypothetical protein